MEKNETRAVLSDEERRSVELLRIRGLSIRNLDHAERLELCDSLFHLHHKRGLSLSDIARLIGNKTSGYTSWLYRSLNIPVRPFEESRLKAIREKRRKYERKPFDGTDEERAYMLGLRHGDLSVSRPWKGVVRVSTSTTHPAMAELFRGLFGRYGHVYQTPRYKKDTKSYEWNLYTILDSSFSFLDFDLKECWAWVRKTKGRMLAYVAGVLDAEGHIGIFRNYKTIAIVVSIFNTNISFLREIKASLQNLGYGVLGPYLDKKKGTSSSKYRITRKKDYWRIALADFERCQTLLSSLPLRHIEKVQSKTLALTLHKGMKWEGVRPSVEELRAKIRANRDDFVQQAAELVKQKKKKRTN